MTVKRRLFMLNILMMILPMLLAATLFFTIRYHLVVLPNSEFGSAQYLSSRRMLTWSIGMAFFLLLLMFLANRALTKYISGSILSSLDVLVNGVQEISEGNLTHRIQYNKGDEFDVVCANFNEMAARLSDMVEQRQLDERSRKELIAGISHDLRTPLTSIKMCVDGFENSVTLTPEKQEKYVDIIRRKTEDLEYIIKQLFVFSKMDIGEFPLHLEVVNVGDELDKLVEIFSDEYEKEGLEVTFRNDTQKEYVLIDRVQFKNIVQNILSNSLKYSKRKDVCVEISCQKIGDDVSIIIKDNGPGVPDEMLEKIFDVFFRGDMSRNNLIKGSGLGLAISSKIIHRLGGEIKAENVIAGGLAITITLPIEKGEKI